VAALTVVEAAIVRAERKGTRVVDELGARRIPRERVALDGDPEVLFLNVNTPEGQRLAEEMAGWKP
jgi:hypothetical protein